MEDLVSFFGFVRLLLKSNSVACVYTSFYRFFVAVEVIPPEESLYFASRISRNQRQRVVLEISFLEQVLLVLSQFPVSCHNYASGLVVLTVAKLAVMPVMLGMSKFFPKKRIFL